MMPFALSNPGFVSSLENFPTYRAGVLALTGKEGYSPDVCTAVANSYYGVTPGDLSTFGLAQSFVTPVTGTYSFTVQAGAGSDGQGGSSGGSTSSFTFSAEIPAGRRVIALAGNAGYRDGDVDTESDAIAGGSGGASWVAYEDPSGNVTYNGKQFRVLFIANGGGAGNDAVYQGEVIDGAVYSDVHTTAVSSLPVAAGQSYNRDTATSYGGFPGGVGSDDIGHAGGGPGYNYAMPGLAVTRSDTMDGGHDGGQVIISGPMFDIPNISSVKAYLPVSIGSHYRMLLSLDGDTFPYVIPSSIYRRLWKTAPSGCLTAGFAYSTDLGMSWKPSNISAPYSSMTGFCVGQGKILGYQNNYLYTSTDGVTWTTTTFNYTIGGVAFGNGTFVLVLGASSSATGPTSYTSTDGISWVAGNLPLGKTWASLVFAGGYFYTLRTNAESYATCVYHSTDGMSWSPTISSGVASLAYSAKLLTDGAKVYLFGAINSSSVWPVYTCMAGATSWVENIPTYAGGVFALNAALISLITHLPSVGKFYGVLGNSRYRSSDGLTWVIDTMPASSYSYGYGIPFSP